MRELGFRAFIKPLGRYASGIDTIQFHKCCDVAGAWIWTVVTANEGIFEGDDIIIEQDTGLKDKNGEMIRGGDILKFRGRAYEVKFDNYGQFYMENKNYHWLENGYSFRSVDIWCAEGILVEVIGNIHENPELLDVKKEG